MDRSRSGPPHRSRCRQVLRLERWSAPRRAVRDARGSRSPSASDLERSVIAPPCDRALRRPGSPPGRRGYCHPTPFAGDRPALPKLHLTRSGVSPATGAGTDLAPTTSVKRARTRRSGPRWDRCLLRRDSRAVRHDQVIVSDRERQGWSHDVDQPPVSSPGRPRPYPRTIPESGWRRTIRVLRG